MNGLTEVENALLWMGQAVTTGGVATFYPTSDGTGSGVALFSSVTVVSVAAEANTGVITAAPVASLKAVAADRKSVTVNAAIGTVLGIVGATMLTAPDGTNVHLLLLGIQ